MGIPAGPERSVQWRSAVSKRDGRVTREAGLSVQFVPMTGEARRR